MECTAGSEKIMAQEVFDAMVVGAVDDLKASGLTPDQIYAVVEAQLGSRYAKRFCTQSAEHTEGGATD